MRSRLAPHHAWLRWLALGCALMLGEPVTGTDASDVATRKPNILFLLADDQRADTIHALGNPVIETPNLDRLAATGLAIRNAYCMGGDQPAVCLPSRTMLLSGRSLFHLNELSPGSPNFARTLRAAGYLTYHHGKSGNTPHRIQQDFEQNHYLANDDRERRSGHPGREIADAAIAFLKTNRDPRPFFMYLAFANPHDPRVVVPQDRNRYDEARLPLPVNFRPLHPFDNGELTVRDEALAPWPRTPDAVRHHLADYYGVITHLDREIGRILRALEDEGKADNTLILFSSDHGLAIGSHGLFGKQNVYEDGMRVPLIVAGPGIPRGRSNAMVYLHDLYPTVCELAGIPVPEGLDGQSFASVVGGHSRDARDVIFLAYRSCQRAVRLGDWKLIRYPQINKSQLFNLKDDPGETDDVAGDSRHAARVAGLMSLLEQQQRLAGDTVALTSKNPRPAEVDASFFEHKKD